MKLVWLHSTVAMAMVGTLALVGCSGSDDENPTPSTSVDTGFAVVPEVGINNNMVTDPDGGTPDVPIFVPDTGPQPDLGFPDTGIIPGAEGFECTSSPTDLPFLQDDCQAGLLCVPWDVVWTDDNSPPLSGPVQGCVLPCQTDADCGTNDDGSPRFCADTNFNEESGIARICVDELAGPDEYCGFSRLNTSRLPGVGVETGRRMVGCEEGADCFATVFSDVHPDEGICFRLCDTDTQAEDCTNPATPYCNPNVFGEGTGVCSERQAGVGALCGAAEANKAGITSRCDTSAATSSVTICLPEGFIFGGNSPFVLEGDQGICTQICGLDRLPGCAADPVLGATECTDPFIPLVGGDEAGVCASDCTRFEDNCGPGRFCPFEGGYCWDIVEPTLAPGRLNELDQVVLAEGDNCLADPDLFLSCPEDSWCYQVDVGADGRCLFSCSRGADADPAFCSTALGTTTATCAAVFEDNSVGLCSAR